MIPAARAWRTESLTDAGSRAIWAGAMRASFLTAGAVAVLLFGGCRSTPDDLRVWRPSDHDQAELTQAQNANDDADGGSAAAAPQLPPGITQVVLVAWKQNCTPCHGMFGKGDGPEGPMVGARDLTDPNWQSSTSDAEIAQTIEKGLGRMPHFDFPNSTVQGLVKLVRMMNAAGGGPAAAGRGPAAGAASEAGTPEPAAPHAKHSSTPGSPHGSKRVAASGAR
jgi:Cytochrome C oxidase, cbb3-type, subunit III